jgi:hypothetical protein
LAVSLSFPPKNQLQAASLLHWRNLASSGLLPRPQDCLPANPPQIWGKENGEEIGLQHFLGGIFMKNGLV